MPSSSDANVAGGTSVCDSAARTGHSLASGSRVAREYSSKDSYDPFGGPATRDETGRCRSFAATRSLAFLVNSFNTIDVFTRGAVSSISFGAILVDSAGLDAFNYQLVPRCDDNCSIQTIWLFQKICRRISRKLSRPDRRTDCRVRLECSAKRFRR